MGAVNRQSKPGAKIPLWQALREREEPVSAQELATDIDISQSAITWRLSRWVREGLLSVSYGERPRYLMNDNSRSLPAPPAMEAKGAFSARRYGRDRMWRSIRILQRFDLVQLQLAASVSENTARVFVNFLVRAGLLSRVTRGNKHNGKVSVYAVAGKFGPKTPLVRQWREQGVHRAAVIDPNTGTTHDIRVDRAGTAPFFEGER